MTSIYDLTDVSDVPFDTEVKANVVDRCVAILNDYDRPATINEIKVFYWRKHGVEISRKYLGNVLARATNLELIFRVKKRGVYCSAKVKSFLNAMSAHQQQGVGGQRP